MSLASDVLNIELKSEINDITFTIHPEIQGNSKETFNAQDASSDLQLDQLLDPQLQLETELNDDEIQQLRQELELSKKEIKILTNRNKILKQENEHLLGKSKSLKKEQTQLPLAEREEILVECSQIEINIQQIRGDLEAFQAKHGTFVAFGHFACLESITSVLKTMGKFTEENNIDSKSIQLVQSSLLECKKLAASYKNMIADCFQLYEHSESLNSTRKNERQKMSKFIEKMKTKNFKDTLGYKKEISELRNSIENLEVGKLSVEESELKQSLQKKYLGLVDELKRKTNGLLSENDQLRTYSKDLEVAIDKWVLENQKLRESIKILNEKTSNNQDSELKKQITLLEKEKALLEQELHLRNAPNSLAASALQLNAIDSKLEAIKQIHEDKDKQYSLSEYKSIINEQKSVIEKLTSQNKDLKIMVSQLKKDYKSKQENIQLEIEKIQQNFNLNKNSYQTFEESLKDYERQHRDIIIMSESLKEISGLSILADSIREKTRDAKGHPFSFSSYFNEMQSLYIRLKQDQQKEVEKLNELDSIKQTLEKENLKFKDELKESIDKAEKLNNEIQSLQQRISDTLSLLKESEQAKLSAQEKLKSIVKGCRTIFNRANEYQKFRPRVPKVIKIQVSDSGSSSEEDDFDLDF